MPSMLRYIVAIPTPPAWLIAVFWWLVFTLATALVAVLLVSFVLWRAPLFDVGAWSAWSRLAFLLDAGVCGWLVWRGLARYEAAADELP